MMILDYQVILIVAVEYLGVEVHWIVEKDQHGSHDVGGGKIVVDVGNCLIVVLAE